MEREVLALMREAGLEAKRVPLSGSAPGYPGDLEVVLPGLGKVVVEVKARKRVALEAWLEGRGLLVLKPDRRPPLAVMPLEALLALVRAAKGEGAGLQVPTPHPEAVMGFTIPPPFQEMGGVRNRATGHPSTGSQPQPHPLPRMANRNGPRPSWPGFSPPSTAPPNRFLNRSNRTLNRFNRPANR